jgi:hypothetical protein
MASFFLVLQECRITYHYLINRSTIDALLLTTWSGAHRKHKTSDSKRCPVEQSIAINNKGRYYNQLALKAY